jgi:hypothetical protein
MDALFGFLILGNILHFELELLTIPNIDLLMAWRTSVFAAELLSGYHNKVNGLNFYS